MDNVTPGYATTEFWAMIAAKVGGFVFVLVLLGFVPATDQDSLTKTVAALVLGVGAIVTNGLMVWRYIAARQAIKMERELTLRLRKE